MQADAQNASIFFQRYYEVYLRAFEYATVNERYRMPDYSSAAPAAPNQIANPIMPLQEANNPLIPTVIGNILDDAKEGKPTPPVAPSVPPSESLLVLIPELPDNIPNSQTLSSNEPFDVKEPKIEHYRPLVRNINSHGGINFDIIVPYLPSDLPTKSSYGNVIVLTLRRF